MQLDIFNPSQSDDYSIADRNAGISNPHSPMNIADHYTRLWNSYRVTLNRYADELKELYSQEQSFFPGDDYGAAIRIHDSYTIGKLEDDVASRIERRLIKHAEATFAPPGVPLTIDADRLRECVPKKRKGTDDFSPTKVWQFLEQKYAQGLGEQLAWQQAAKALYRAFGLEHRKEVVRKGAYVILRISVWVESYCRGPGTGRLSLNSGNNVQEAFSTFSTFLHWTGREALASELKGAIQKWGYDREVTSREKTCFGKDEIIVTTFLERFEFKIKADIAEQLQIFLGTFNRHGEE